MGWVMPQTGISLNVAPLPPIGGASGNQTYPDLTDLSEETADVQDKEPDPEDEEAAKPEEPEATIEVEPEPTMRGGLFLVLYTVSNVVILFLCTAYIVVTKRDLSTEADDALIIPQILAVIPGSLHGYIHKKKVIVNPQV